MGANDSARESGAIGHTIDSGVRRGEYVAWCSCGWEVIASNSWSARDWAESHLRAVRLRRARRERHQPEES